MTKFTIMTKRMESQRKFALPMIEKKILEAHSRPTVLYMNLMGLFAGSALAKNLIPNQTELDELKDYVSRELMKEGHKVRVNETPVIEVSLS